MGARPGAILITGCSTGIGRETARRLAGKGWTVYASARRPEAIADLEAEGCHTLALDVDDEGSMAAAVAKIEDEQGQIWGLVNNAGYSQSGAVESLPLDSIRAQFETNVFGLLRMCQLALPGMRASGGGRIINISSMGGRLVFPGGGAYHATKYAVEAFSDALRFEVDGFGVKVVLIEPGLIRTEFGDTAAGSLSGASTEGAGGDAYAHFNASVGAITQGAYDGTIGKLFGGRPGAVARKIERALSSSRPRARYRVTPSASVIMAQRRLMPDRTWDAAMRAQFPRPGSDS